MMNKENLLNPQMVRLITQKGGKVIDTGVVNWTNKLREEQIKDIVARFCNSILYPRCKDSLEKIK